MSSAKMHMKAITNAVEALGYVFTDEYFDFETIPVSGHDEVYRVEARTGELGSMSGSRVQKTKHFDIWVAFRLLKDGKKKEDFYDILDAKEDLEDTVLQATSLVLVQVEGNVMSAVKDEYIIVKLTGSLIYWRDLSPLQGVLLARPSTRGTDFTAMEEQDMQSIISHSTTLRWLPGPSR